MIVVTGATGNVGRPLVRALAEAGERVLAVSRRITGQDIPEGVRHEQADLAEPEQLKPVLDGATALFLLTPPDFLAGGDIGRLLASGVRRVVLLSSQGVGTQRHPSIFEDAVKGSSPEWTVLRPGGFHSNALQWADIIRTERAAAAPFADVALPTIDPGDIAAAAAVVLREDGHSGRTYELTGPEAISPRQQIAAIAEALGEPVSFTELSRTDAKAQMLRFMPEPVVEGTLAVLGEPTAAEQLVSPDVQRLLGRAPRTFAEWAGRNRAAFK
ncbi:NAD(P)H-binding protein [Allokutzneria sp. A3M-2-11 16]|uniref:SDR family oxidoreductase n=1 Tax=Allokutzneria sp. A3M-2-11 16 TaxID=2962043 RepID=UPI0020B63B85|nr:NAD(P)H-binding protein [Allokutzneria sp. A3M-2-11 16]MCP3798205.1 NAD(P)H-binding protein [Allokutzneria sp. A3M-2-11 16]